jgi:positive regulator of sigma E activity
MAATNSPTLGHDLRPHTEATPGFGTDAQVEYGVVREIERSAAARSVQTGTSGTASYGVEITTPGACDQCLIKDNCYGSGAVVWANADEPLAVGDHVRLEMRPGTVLRATGWVYGIPLLALAAGLLAGYYLAFRNLGEQARVLLSTGLAFGLMVAAGAILARLNDWVSRRITIEAFRTNQGDDAPAIVTRGQDTPAGDTGAPSDVDGAGPATTN